MYQAIWRFIAIFIFLVNVTLYLMRKITKEDMVGAGVICNFLYLTNIPIPKEK